MLVLNATRTYMLNIIRKEEQSDRPAWTDVSRAKPDTDNENNESHNPSCSTDVVINISDKDIVVKSDQNGPVIDAIASNDNDSAVSNICNDKEQNGPVNNDNVSNDKDGSVSNVCINKDQNDPVSNHKDGAVDHSQKPHEDITEVSDKPERSNTDIRDIDNAVRQ